MEKRELSKSFGSYEIPETLVALLDFVNNVSRKRWFSESFQFMVDIEKIGLKTYSSEEAFLNRLVEFAYADATGSTYAFWLQKKDDSLENAPIVVFGSEGGYHLVAINTRRFLQLLSYDVEPMIDWEEVSYFKDDEDYEPSEYHETYKKWLQETFMLEIPMDVDFIVEEAQSYYQEAFNDWMAKYYSS